MEENDLLKAINELEKSIKSYSIITDVLTTSPFSIGYTQNSGVWIVYMINERGEFHLKKHFASKVEALNYLLELIKFQISLEE